MITVKLMGVLGLFEILQEREIFFSLPQDTSLREFLKLLFDKYGDELQRRVLVEKGRDELKLNIYLNGRSIYFLNGLDLILQDEDTVLLIPVAGGG